MRSYSVVVSHSTSCLFDTQKLFLMPKASFQVELKVQTQVVAQTCHFHYQAQRPSSFICQRLLFLQRQQRVGDNQTLPMGDIVPRHRYSALVSHPELVRQPHPPPPIKPVGCTFIFTVTDSTSLVTQLSFNEKRYFPSAINASG